MSGCVVTVDTIIADDTAGGTVYTVVGNDHAGDPAADSRTKNLAGGPARESQEFLANPESEKVPLQKRGCKEGLFTYTNQRRHRFESR